MGAKRIFISYSHRDSKPKAYVETHLAPLRRHHAIDVWSDKNISAGDNWAEALAREMDRADAAIFLVSANFLASDFVQSVEVPKLLRRRRESGLPVWPVILSPCGWKQVPWLTKLQIRPAEAAALSSMTKPKRDAAMAAFAAEVHGVLTPTGGSTKKSVTSELRISKDFTRFSEDERIEFLNLLNKSLGQDGAISIRRVKPGSTRLFVEMTEAQVEKLKMLLRDGFYDHRTFEFRGLLSEDEKRGLELFQFRNRPVIRDEAVAALFGVSTKQLNQAVKRNAEKFDDDQAFILSNSEWRHLQSQIVTSKIGRGGRRTPPRMFTEQGVVMSSTVLRSPQAVEAAKLLVRVFVAARHTAKATRSNSFGANDGKAITDGLRVFDDLNKDK